MTQAINESYLNLATPLAATLDQVKVGAKARITGYVGQDLGFRRKLLALGLTPGAEVQIMRVAPLGDPIQIKLRGACVSLRRSEAATFLVEAI